MLLPQLRQIVCGLHAELPTNNLVAWTSSTISARDPQRDRVVIKPSSVKFPDLTLENVTVVNLAREIVEGDLKASHCLVYRHMPQVTVTIRQSVSLLTRRTRSLVQSDQHLWTVEEVLHKPLILRQHGSTLPPAPCPGPLAA